MPLARRFDLSLQGLGGVHPRQGRPGVQSRVHRDGLRQAGLDARGDPVQVWPVFRDGQIRERVAQPRACAPARPFQALGQVLRGPAACLLQEPGQGIAPAPGMAWQGWLRRRG